MSTFPPYEATCNNLSDHILDLMKKDPKVAEITDIWDLLRVEGYEGGKYEPSLAQAIAAFEHAREKYQTIK